MNLFNCSHRFINDILYNFKQEGAVVNVQDCKGPKNNQIESSKSKVIFC